MSKLNLTSDNVTDSLETVALQIDSLNLSNSGVAIISLPEGFPKSGADRMIEIFNQVGEYAQRAGVNTSLGIVIWRGPLTLQMIPEKDLNAHGWYKKKPRKSKAANAAP